MKLKKLDLIDLLISESARREITVEPDWWKKLSVNQRAKYLEKHKNSQMAKFLKKKEEAKKARQKKLKIEKSPVEKPAELDEEVLAALDQTVAEENARVKKENKAKKKALKKEVKQQNKSVEKSSFADLAKKLGKGVRKFFKKPNKKKKALLEEKLMREEVERRKQNLKPGILSGMRDQYTKFTNNIPSVSAYIKESVSGLQKSKLGGYLKDRMEGRDTTGSEGERVAMRVGIGIAQAALGLGTIVAVASGTAPLAGLLAGAFFGFRDYTKAHAAGNIPPIVQPEPEKPVANSEGPVPPEEKSKESEPSLTVTEKPKQETEAALEDEYDDAYLAGLDKQIEGFDQDNPDLESKSAEYDDPIDAMVDEFAYWIGTQDMEALADVIAEYTAIQSIRQEGWRPKVSMLDDEELEDLSSEVEQEELESNSSDQETDEDFEQEFVDQTSDGVKRITLRCDPKMLRLPQTERRRYHIRYGNSIIGTISCVNKICSKAKRDWICVLEDGFNESVYRSGRPLKNDVPYTMIRNGKIYMINPVKMTLPEMYGWVRMNVDKEYL